VHTVRRIALGVATLVIVATAAVLITAWHQGYRVYVVHTGSMAPTLNPGDAVLDRPAPHTVRPGEIVTFAVHSGPDSVVTHRVASYDGTVVKTKGDANRSVDPWSLHLSQVVGSALTRLPLAGYVLVYLQHPQGIASVLTVTLGLILLWQLFFPAAPGDPLDQVSEHTAETTENRRATYGARQPRHGRPSVPAGRIRQALRLPS